MFKIRSLTAILILIIGVIASVFLLVTANLVESQAAVGLFGVFIGAGIREPRVRSGEFSQCAHRVGTLIGAAAAEKQ